MVQDQDRCEATGCEEPEVVGFAILRMPGPPERTMHGWVSPHEHVRVCDDHHRLWHVVYNMSPSSRNNPTVTEWEGAVADPYDL